MSAIQPLARVVSVCSKKDIETWSVACRHIVKFIDANEYLIVVPDAEVDEFKSVTCSPYKVLPETSYVGDLKGRIQTLLPIENHDRIGWYLQQFIKIAAAKRAPVDGNTEAVILIWDADTIPLKQLKFVNDDGKLIYYQGSEQHQPYFEFIEKAFGLKRKCEFSFIAQCFPAKISWVQSFCNALESKGHDWVESIILNLDQSQRAGFSEYESLGTFIWNNYPNQVGLSNQQWERNGQKLLGKPSQLSELEWLGLSSTYDYISFEVWDSNKGLGSKWRAYRNRLKFREIGRSNSRFKKSPI